MCFAVWKTTNLLTCESDWTSGSSSSHLFLNQYKPTESENSQWTFTWLWHTVEVCCHLLVMQVYYRRAADLYDNKKLITYGITYGVSPFKKYTCHFKWNALKLQCNYTLSQKLFFLFLNIKCPWITLSQEFNARSCLMGRLQLIWRQLGPQSNKHY